jgi:hypothetical protein
MSMCNYPAYNHPSHSQACSCEQALFKPAGDSWQATPKKTREEVAKDSLSLPYVSAPAYDMSTHRIGDTYLWGV